MEKHHSSHITTPISTRNQFLFGTQITLKTFLLDSDPLLSLMTKIRITLTRILAEIHTGITNSITRIQFNFKVSWMITNFVKTTAFENPPNNDGITYPVFPNPFGTEITESHNEAITQSLIDVKQFPKFLVTKDVYHSPQTSTSVPKACDCVVQINLWLPISMEPKT